MGFEPGTHVSPASRKAAADCRAVRERVPLYFPCAKRPGRLGWACWLSCGLGAKAKGSWGRPCLSGLLAQTRAGCAAWVVGVKDQAAGWGRSAPGQGGLGWRAGGCWAGLKPVLGGLGCGLLARVAGWAGPEAGSRQVRQAGLAWLGWPGPGLGRLGWASWMTWGRAWAGCWLG